MKGPLVFAGVILVIALAAVFAASKNPILHLIGGLLLGLISLSLTALTLFLISVGVRNHWSSDGPGMLMIMIGIGVLGVTALGSWMITLGAFFGKRRMMGGSGGDA